MGELWGVNICEKIDRYITALHCITMEMLYGTAASAEYLSWIHTYSFTDYNFTTLVPVNGELHSNNMSGQWYTQLHWYKTPYCQTSNIRCTLVGNEIVDPSDVVGAAPVGAAPTTSSFST